MDRRNFVKGVAVGAGAAALTSCDGEGNSDANTATGPAVLRKKRNLKLVTSWQKNYPGLGVTPERIAQHVNEATDGAISIKVYAAGELVGAFDSFDAVSTGSADMYHAAEYYWQGKSPAFNFFTAVPMGLTANELMAWIYYGGGQELWDELSSKFTIKAFMAGNTGTQMGGWFRKEINTLDDLKGLKIRMPGLGGEVLRRLGAAAVALPQPEIYTSLQSGNIDGAEWAGPWNDLTMGFYQITKYYYWPGFHEPGSALSLGINLDLWNDLTPGEQRIIEDACAAENSRNLAEYNRFNTEALRTLIDEHGVQLKRFNSEILTEIGRLCGEVVKEAGQTDNMSKRIYESFLQTRSNVSSWSEISEEGFWAARRLPFDYG